MDEEATFSDDRERNAKRVLLRCCALSLAFTMVVTCFHGVLQHVVVPEMNKTFSSWSENIGRRPGPEDRSQTTPSSTTSARSSLLRAKSPLPEVLLCNTSACLDFSARTAQLLREAINPCGDFYKYACDSWQHDHALRRQAHYVSTDTVYLKQYVNMLKKALFKPGAIPKLGFLYQVCKKVTGDTLYPRLLSTFLYTLNIRKLALLDGQFSKYSRRGPLSYMVSEQHECSSSCDIADVETLPAIPLVNWTSLFQGLLGVDVRVDRVRVTSPQYLLNLYKNFKFDKADILNHIVLRVMILILPFVSDDVLFDRIAAWKVSKEHLLPFEATREDQCLHTMLEVEPYMPMELVRSSHLVKLSNARVAKDVLTGPSFAFAFIDHLREVFQGQDTFLDALFKNIALIQVEVLSPSSLTKAVVAFQVHRQHLHQNPATPLLYFVYYYVKNAAMKRQRPLAASQNESWTGWTLHFSDAMPRLDPPFTTLQIPITAFDLMLPTDPVVELFHLPRVAFRAYRTLSEYVLYYVREHNITSARATLESLRMCLKHQSDESIITEEESSKAGMNPVLDFLAAGSAYNLFRSELSRIAKRVRFKGLEDYRSGQLFAAVSRRVFLRERQSRLSAVAAKRGR
ncbi:hypothetical protein HPB52_017812 [Rhipicephalus sanguineus]|uniref:Uncharacterized protein n=1 Tax=Rhipicephalus sanguineus TaxID=34632 RepID=A0A9D4SYT8_RHISA|nr:hypothetical protein HPB52_017812 [Rhipicephalus sanguineus]